MNKEIELAENEIIVSAHPVKHTGVEYHERYATITQNRVRRRVYNGFHFYNDGVYIHVSTYYSGLFQHKKKIKKYIVNTETKEWREFDEYLISRHSPVPLTPKDSNIIDELKNNG